MGLYAVTHIEPMGPFFRDFPPNKYEEGSGTHRVLEFIRIHGYLTTDIMHNRLRVDTVKLRCWVKPYLRDNKIIQEPAKKIAEGNYLYRFVRAEG